MQREVSMFDPDTGRAIARQLLKHLKDGTTDLAAEVMEIDPSDYTDPQVLRQELDLIFRRLPLVVAHTSQLPEAGDFLKLSLPECDVLLVRQETGEVAAFPNQCRHRGAPITEESCGNRRRFT